MNEAIVKLDFIKIKTCALQKWLLVEWKEKIFENQLSDKGTEYKMCKEL